MKCIICGKDFFSNYSNKMYCSRACGKTAHNNKNKLNRSTITGKAEHNPKACVYCGKTFIPKNIKSKYCSDACRRGMWYRGGKMEPEYHDIIKRIEKNKKLISAQIQVLRGNFGIDFQQTNKKFSERDCFEEMRRKAWNE